MRVVELSKRNFKEVWLDPLWLGVTIALPAGLLAILQAIGGGPLGKRPHNSLRPRWHPE